MYEEGAVILLFIVYLLAMIKRPPHVCEALFYTNEILF